MIQWLCVIGAFVVSCFTFWKLGKNDGIKEEKLKENEKRLSDFSRADYIISSASVEFDELHKENMQ